MNHSKNYIAVFSATLVFALSVNLFGTDNKTHSVTIANAQVKNIVTDETINVITDTTTTESTTTTTETSSQTTSTTTTTTETQTEIIEEITTEYVETTTAITEPVLTNYETYNLNLSENDMIMMCTIVSSETGYCDDLVQKAVAHTIINRVVSDKFPNDMYSVCTQNNQYTAIHSYFDGQYRVGLEPGSDGWNHTMEMCKEALNEYDFTNGAFAYYNPDICGYNSWFESLNLVYTDQYGRFFNW